MLAIVMILAAAGFGAAVVRRLGLDVTRLERWALASAIALTAAPWVWFAGAAAVGFTAGLPLATAALALAGIVLGRHRHTGPGGAATALPATSALSWWALGLLLLQLFHAHMLHDERGGLFTGGFTYSDLPLHSTLAHHYASTSEMTLESPLVAGQPLTYPFLGDFLVGCLMRGGWSASLAFTISGWISVMTFLALVQAVALRMFGRSSAATLAAWFIVLNGSIVAVTYVVGDLRAHGLRPVEQMPDYAHLFRHGFHASNLTKDFFLPQRSLVSALPACWAVIWMIQTAVRHADDRAVSRRALAAAAVFTGALPFLHAHTFFVAVGLLGWFAMWRSLAGRRVAGAWFLAAAAALALAAPQLAWQFGQTWKSDFGRVNLGWMTPRDGSVLWFWLKNWGLALVLVPVNVAVALRLTRRDFALPLYSALLVVFVAANVYQFQPNVWDNMKFLIHSYMAVALLAAGGVAHWLARPGARRWVAAVAVAGMTMIGALSVLRATEARDQLASRSEVKMAARLRAVLPADARVLTADAHNHVVPMLTGRRIVMGFRGWLWTHGVDYRALERDVRTMFAGGLEAKPLLRRHRVTHVYIGPQERAQWGAALDDFKERYPSVYAVDGIEVFDVRRLSTARASARVSVK